jgi:ubiquinone/menaquinone biosynthesis C-methylase UbiE/uncharacterized protein YbaR (Trm112 family)
VTEFAPGLHARAGQDVDSSAYDSYVGRWSRLFVPSVIVSAQVQSGSTVLDISTGTGEAAVAALPVIGPSGTLVGADISPEMVRSAVQRVGDTRFLPIAADGQELPFRNGCFDAVICQLGLQFFPDPARGLSEFRRVLRPGGRACVCVISNPDRAPMWGFLAEAIARRLPEKRDMLMASFALADAKRVESLFRGAGFVNVSVTREVRGGTIKTLDEYWDPILAGTGSIPQAYVLLEERERRDVREEVSTRLSEFVVGSELHIDVEMLIGHGQADPDDDKSSQTTLSLPAPIDPRLGEILVCPKTKGALEYNAPANELISLRAGLAFPIRDGIPIMLLNSARAVGGIAGDVE